MWPEGSSNIGTRFRAATSWGILVLLLLAFLAITLHRLDTVPPVHQDEPLIASSAWRLATDGVFGVEMLAGFHRAESRVYLYPPVFPLLQAAVFHFAGLGVLQMRSPSILAGLATMVLTFLLGRRLHGAGVGLLAVGLLLVWRLAGPLGNRLTGIYLLDAARVARYDILVPVFGLSALFVYLGSRLAPRRLFVAGLLVGLAALSHVYGAFWLVVLSILATLETRGSGRGLGRGALALVLGFGVPCLLYAGYVLTDVGAWRGQVVLFASPERLGWSDPAWYARNVLREPLRYVPGLRAPDPSLLLRPGIWLGLLAVPAATWRLARGGRPRDRAVVVPLLVVPLLFALLIQPKVPAYVIGFWPIVALAVSAWGVAVWRDAGRVARSGLIVLSVAVVMDGAGRIAALARTSATPYGEFTTAVAAHVPPDARVLGIHTYWLGLADRDYRDWLVPMADDRSLPAALDEVAPDVLLLDDAVRLFFSERPAESAALRAWSARRGFERSAVVEDETYGRIEVYRRLR